MIDTTRALVSGIGPDWVLREVPRPQPAAGQILVRNRAAATNNADLPMLAPADPTHGGHGNRFIAGFEYAGDVVALGDDPRFVLPRPGDLDPAGFTRDQEMAEVIAALLPEVIPAVARGQIRPVIDSTLGLTLGKTAADRLRSGEAVGKIVLSIAPS